MEQSRKICFFPDCTTNESTSGKALYPFLVDADKTTSFLIAVGSSESVNVSGDCGRTFLCSDHVGNLEGLNNMETTEEDEEEPQQLSQQLSTLSVSNPDVAEVVEISREERNELTEPKSSTKTCTLCGKEKTDFVMMRYLPVKISENEHLPKIVCLDCDGVLSTFHELAMTSRATEAHFESLVEGQSVDIDGTLEEIKAKPKYTSSPKDNESPKEKGKEDAEKIEVNLEDQCSQDTKTDPEGSVHSQDSLISEDDAPFTTFEGLKQLKNAEKRRRLQTHDDERPAKMRKLETNFEKWFECTRCPATFADEATADFHRHRHRLKHPVVAWCHYCCTEFPKKRILMRHIVAVHKEDSCSVAYKCKLCNELFLMRSSAIIHVIGDCAPHPIENYSFDRYVDDVFVKCAYTCELCFSSFTVLASLLEHNCKKFRRAEWKSDIGSFGMRASFACKLCTRIFIHYNSFVQHTQEHTDGRFSCSVCGETFPAYDDVKKHREGDHHYQIVYRERPGRLYVCFCGMEFDSERDFAVHEKNHFLTANLYKISLDKTVAQPINFTESFDNFVSSFFGKILTSPEKSQSN